VIKKQQQQEALFLFLTIKCVLLFSCYILIVHNSIKFVKIKQKKVHYKPDGSCIIIEILL
jgi:hypothetical protein